MKHPNSYICRYRSPCLALYSMRVINRIVIPKNTIFHHYHFSTIFQTYGNPFYVVSIPVAIINCYLNTAYVWNGVDGRNLSTNTHTPKHKHTHPHTNTHKQPHPHTHTLTPMEQSRNRQIHFIFLNCGLTQLPFIFRGCL